jgi:hypothetical protein
MGRVFGQIGSFVADISDWLSVAGFLLAIWATWGVRRLRKAYQDLVRGQDLLEELQKAASEISDAASDVEANRDALLLAFVSAEATLEGLKARVGEWYVFWGDRGDLKSDIDTLRRDLKGHHDNDARHIDRATAMAEYRRIQRIVLRVVNIQRDRRLER